MKFVLPAPVLGATGVAELTNAAVPEDAAALFFSVFETVSTPDGDIRRLRSEHAQTPTKSIEPESNPDEEVRPTPAAQKHSVSEIPVGPAVQRSVAALTPGMVELSRPTSANRKPVSVDSAPSSSKLAMLPSEGAENGGSEANLPLPNRAEAGPSRNSIGQYHQGQAEFTPSFSVTGSFEKPSPKDPFTSPGSDKKTGIPVRHNGDTIDFPATHNERENPVQTGPKNTESAIEVRGDNKSEKLSALGNGLLQASALIPAIPGETIVETKAVPTGEPSDRGRVSMNNVPPPHATSSDSERTSDSTTIDARPSRNHGAGLPSDAAAQPRADAPSQQGVPLSTNDGPESARPTQLMPSQPEPSSATGTLPTRDEPSRFVAPEAQRAQSSSQPEQGELLGSPPLGKTASVTIPAAAPQVSSLGALLDQTELPSGALEESKTDIQQVGEISSARFTGASVAPPSAKASLLQQIQPHLSDLSVSRSDKIEISLSPDELGRVRLAATQTENGVLLVVQAERPETLDLMRRHLPDLLNDLRDMGFGDINFSDEQKRQKAEQHVAEASADTIDAPETTIQSGASKTGGLDLRL